MTKTDSHTSWSDHPFVANWYTAENGIWSHCGHLLKLVLVTGCSSGIGSAAAVRLAAAGHPVIATVCDLDRSDAGAAGRPNGAAPDVRRPGVTDDTAGRRRVHETVDRHGLTYALVNGAGVTRVDVSRYRHPRIY